jgi:hypothetical protein
MLKVIHGVNLTYDVGINKVKLNIFNLNFYYFEKISYYYCREP